MSGKVMKDLKKNLELAVLEIIKEFEHKQDLKFEFFINNDFTGIAHFGSRYYFSLTNICYDLFTEQPKKLIIEWDNCIEEEERFINYQSYTKGLRYENLKPL